MLKHRSKTSSKATQRLLVAVLLVVASSYGVYRFVAVQGAESSGLVFEQREYDLGEGEPGARIKGVLRLVNHSDQPARFSTQASCGCTDLSPGAGTVDPHESVDVVVFLNLAHAKGNSKAAEVTASWETDSGTEGTARCGIAGRTVYTMIAAPPSVSLLIPPGDARSDVSETVLVTGKGRAQFSAVEDIRVEGSSGITIGSVRMSGESQCRITFSLSEDSPVSTRHRT